MRRKLGATLGLTLAAAGCFPAEWGADAILHPWRRPLTAISAQHDEVAFESDGLKLKGWLFHGRGPRRGLIVSLHGHADNRRGGEGLAQRFGPKGYDVLAYDSRANGESEGVNCTYGYSEKGDLVHALDAIGANRAILFGSSLGAAVALQAAPIEPRVVGVIAQSPFADLDSIIDERAPWFATRGEVEAAKRLAEERAHFRIAEASPLLAAPLIHVPVLLIHGAADRETRPVNSERIFKALNSPRQLLLVPGAGHDDVLGREEVWQEIESFVRSLD